MTSIHLVTSYGFDLLRLLQIHKVIVLIFSIGQLQDFISLKQIQSPEYFWQLPPKSSKKTYLFTFGTLKAQAHVALKIKIIDIKYVSISSKYVHTYTHINIFCTQLKSREGIKDMKCLLKTCVKQINHILILQVSQPCVKKNIEQNVSDYFNVIMVFS